MFAFLRQCSTLIILLAFAAVALAHPPSSGRSTSSGNSFQHGYNHGYYNHGFYNNAFSIATPFVQTQTIYVDPVAAAIFEQAPIVSYQIPPVTTYNAPVYSAPTYNAPAYSLPTSVASACGTVGNAILPSYSPSIGYAAASYGGVVPTAYVNRVFAVQGFYRGFHR